MIFQILMKWKLLIDIIPQNKLILINDNNNKPSIIKTKESDNLINYPKTNLDNFVIYDKNGKNKNIEKKHWKGDKW